MSNISQTYKNHEEKKKYFSLKIIDDENKFKELFEFILPQKYKQGGIWRGLPESSYKLYSTFQRENLQIKNPIKDAFGFVEQLERQFDIWDSKNIVQKFFNNFGIDKVPLYSKLSILRHYGVPSPLLDWTRNPNVAFHFSAKNIATNVVEGELRDYFSIYFIDKEHPFYKYNSKVGAELFESNTLKNIIERYKIYKCLFPSRKKVNSIFNSPEDIYKHIIEHPIQRISDEQGDYVNHLTLTNLNITAQDGLFILNMDPLLPLEEAIIDRTKQLAPNSFIFEEAYKRHVQNFICFEIHKKFIPQICQSLKSDDVNIIENNIPPGKAIELTNFPNPFNPSTTIQFSSEPFEPNEQISLEIYNIKGQKIRQFNIQNLQFKMNKVVWDGTDEFKQPVSSGMYLYQIRSSSGILGTKKMILMK